MVFVSGLTRPSLALKRFSQLNALQLVSIFLQPTPDVGARWFEKYISAHAPSYMSYGDILPGLYLQKINSGPPEWKGSLESILAMFAVYHLSLLNRF